MTKKEEDNFNNGVSEVYTYYLSVAKFIEIIFLIIGIIGVLVSIFFAFEEEDGMFLIATFVSLMLIIGRKTAGYSWRWRAYMLKTNYDAANYKE